MSTEIFHVPLVASSSAATCSTSTTPPCCTDRTIAERLAELLERHGLADVPDHIPDAVTWAPPDPDDRLHHRLDSPNTHDRRNPPMKTKSLPPSLRPSPSPPATRSRTPSSTTSPSREIEASSVTAEPGVELWVVMIPEGDAIDRCSVNSAAPTATTALLRLRGARTVSLWHLPRLLTLEASRRPAYRARSSARSCNIILAVGVREALPVGVCAGDVGWTLPTLTPALRNETDDLLTRPPAGRLHGESLLRLCELPDPRAPPDPDRRIRPVVSTRGDRMAPP